MQNINPSMPLSSKLVDAVLQSITDLQDLCVASSAKNPVKTLGIPIQPLSNWKNKEMAEIFKIILEKRFREVLV